MRIKKQSVYRDKPEEWDILPIKNIGEVVTGTTPKTSIDEYYGGEYLFVSPGDLDSSRVVKSSEKSLTQKGFEQTRPVPKNSVLFTSIGSTIGKTSIAGCELATNQQINSIITNQRVDPNFLYNSLLFYQNYIKKLAGTQAVPIINKSSFQSLRLPFPPKQEQVKIIETLNIWDKAISTLKNLIKAKKRYKKGLMQQLLSGKKRFSEFEDKPWIEVKLGEVFNERKEKECSHLDLVAITTDNGVIDRDELDRRNTSSSNKDNYKRIVPGDIGYNTMRMWQGVSGYSELEGIVSPAYTIVMPIEDKVDGRFMSYFFKYPPIIDLFRRYSQGLVSDTLNLKHDNFAQIKVKIPKSIKEQRKIRNVLQSADEEIELLNEKLDAFQKKKKGLMQKLLTGKVRVNGKLQTQSA